MPHSPLLPGGMWPDSYLLVGRRKPRRGPGPQGSAKPPGHQRALTSPCVPVASGALGPPHTSSSTSIAIPGFGAQPLPPAEPGSTRPVPRAAQGLAQTLLFCGCRPHPRCQETADSAWRAQTCSPGNFVKLLLCLCRGRSSLPAEGVTLDVTSLGQEPQCGERGVSGSGGGGPGWAPAAR